MPWLARLVVLRLRWEEHCAAEDVEGRPCACCRLAGGWGSRWVGHSRIRVPVGGVSYCDRRRNVFWSGVECGGR